MEPTHLNWGPSPRRVLANGGRTLADQAYQRIREDIIEGRLPPGAKLQPDVLRDRYHIGLSPLREALSRLTTDGLAVSEGQRGIFVAPASYAELCDIGNLHINFACMAFELSMKFGDTAWENSVVTTYYQLNKLERQSDRNSKDFIGEWERRNREFHIALEAGCGSPWLVHFCDILHDQLERYRRLFVAYKHIDSDTYDEHRRIMELALARKPEAVKLLAAHLRTTMEKIERSMSKAGRAAALPGKKRRR